MLFVFTDCAYCDFFFSVCHFVVVVVVVVVIVVVCVVVVVVVEFLM